MNENELKKEVNFLIGKLKETYFNMITLSLPEDIGKEDTKIFQENCWKIYVIENNIKEQIL